MKKWEAIFWGVFWTEIEAETAEEAEEIAREIECTNGNSFYDGIHTQINEFVEVNEIKDKR